MQRLGRYLLFSLILVFLLVGKVLADEDCIEYDNYYYRYGDSWKDSSNWKELKKEKGRTKYKTCYNKETKKDTCYYQRGNNVNSWFIVQSTSVQYEFCQAYGGNSQTKKEQEECANNGRDWDFEQQKCYKHPKEQICELEGKSWVKGQCLDTYDKNKKDCEDGGNLWQDLDENKENHACKWIDDDYSSYNKEDCENNKYTWQVTIDDFGNEKGQCVLKCDKENKEDNPRQCNKPGLDYENENENENENTENEDDSDFKDFKDYRSCRGGGGAWLEEEKRCANPKNLDINQCINNGLNWNNSLETCSARNSIEWEKLNEKGCNKALGHWDEKAHNAYSNKPGLCLNPFDMDEASCKSNSLIWNASVSTCFAKNDPSAGVGLNQGQCQATPGMNWTADGCRSIEADLDYPFDNSDTELDPPNIDVKAPDLSKLPIPDKDKNEKVDLSKLFDNALKKARFFPDSCPANVSFTVFGFWFDLSYAPLCRMAEVAGNFILVIASFLFLKVFSGSFIKD